MAGLLYLSLIHIYHKMKPYKAVERAERELRSANAEYFYQKSLRDNPQIAQAASNPISRLVKKMQSHSNAWKHPRIVGKLYNSRYSQQIQRDHFLCRVQDVYKRQT